MLALLLALQVFHVAFLLLHDWVPLGTLNDVAAVRRESSVAKLITATVVSTLPYGIALGFSLHDQHHGYPHWLFTFLWIAYVLLLAGELQAWWVPYFRGATPERIERYAAMFGNTHAFLASRNGVRINTLHCILHAATALTLVTLAVVTF